jgi:hypothetical protein
VNDLHGNTARKAAKMIANRLRFHASLLRRPTMADVDSVLLQTRELCAKELTRERPAPPPDVLLPKVELPPLVAKSEVPTNPPATPDPQLREAVRQAIVLLRAVGALVSIAAVVRGARARGAHRRTGDLRKLAAAEMVKAGIPLSPRARACGGEALVGSPSSP